MGSFSVAPLAGAWIEMIETPRARDKRIVAPLAGAWIEMPRELDLERVGARRTPRGCVD